MHAVPVCLTIAGSDSGGGAGVQADLKTFAALGVFGTSAITCVTAQNPDEVAGIAPLAPAMVRLQIRTVARGFPVAAAKTGMLYSAPIIRAVAKTIRALSLSPLVVDPVMIATSGARLLQKDALNALRTELLPLATVITPNAPEAEALGGRRIRSVPDLKAAARIIAQRYGVACVVKGGHLAGKRIVDVLCFGDRLVAFGAKPVRAPETHGTGCTFSAALTAYLALGKPLPDAVEAAKHYVTQALARARRIGKHHPLNFLWSA